MARLLFVGLILVSSVLAKGKKDKPTVKDLKNLVTSNLFRNAISALAQGILDDKKFQEKFKKLLGTISSSNEGLTLNLEIDGLSKWGWANPSAAEKRGPKLDKWIKEFDRVSRKPEYVKTATQLFMLIIGTKPFRNSFRDFLKSTKIGIEDQRKNKGKGKKKKAKLTEDSVEYPE